MMKAEPFSVENSSSIRLPVYGIHEQANAKRNLNSGLLPASSPGSTGSLQPCSRNAAVPRPECEVGTGTPVTVLFVSDDDYLRSTTRAYLEHSGFQMRSCSEAARVPDLFFRKREAGSAVDLLLMDVQAMGATGLRLAAELTCFKPELQVVVIAPPGTEEYDLGGITQRGWKFLNKPVYLPRLLGAIRSLLELRRPGVSASSRQLRSEEVQGIMQ